MNVYCLYHKGCLDGIGAAAVVFAKNPQAKLYAVQHGDICPLLIEDGLDSEATIYIVDFSYSYEVIQILAKKFAKVVIIDHHKSFASTANKAARLKGVEVIFDIGYSAAILADRYFFNTPIGFLSSHKILLAIEDRDLWRWERKYTKEITNGLDALRYKLSDEQVIRDLAKNMNERIRFAPDSNKLVQQLVGLGEIVSWFTDRAVEQGLERVVFRKPTINGKKYKMALVNSSMYQSEIGNQVCTRFKNVDYALIWYFDGKEYRVSIRSLKEKDVTTITEIYSGGGHMNAGGFKLKKSPLEEFKNKVK